MNHRQRNYNILRCDLCGKLADWLGVYHDENGKTVEAHPACWEKQQENATYTMRVNEERPKANGRRRRQGGNAR